jgi:hypothetical protein
VGGDGRQHRAAVAAAEVRGTADHLRLLPQLRWRTTDVGLGLVVIRPEGHPSALAEELLQAVEDHVESEEELGLVVVAGLSDVAADDLDEGRVVGQRGGVGGAG